MNNLIELIRKARFVFICGNGGSASTAEHFTNDLFSKGIKAICLNSNVAIMTMIANDFGYEYVFSKQMEIYEDEKDLLIVISGSGDSKNIVNALKKRVCTTFAILGMDGGKAKKLCDYYEIVDNKNYGVIEDVHLQIVHRVKELL